MRELPGSLVDNEEPVQHCWKVGGQAWELVGNQDSGLPGRIGGPGARAGYGA